MRKNYFLIALSAGAISSLAFMGSNNKGIERSWHINGSGAPTGNTGAPGESPSACTQCHSGQVQSGAGINQLVVTEGATPVSAYVPGQTYNVGITFATAGDKNGFQVLCLNTANNAQAGTITLIPGGGTQLLNGSAGKKYVTHNSAGNQQSAWAFQWTAPVTDVGPVRFYLATNQTNNNNSNSGDVIRLSQHDLGSFASVDENKQNTFEAGFSAATGILHINMKSQLSGEGFINLTDLSGKSVFTEKAGKISDGESSIDVRLPDNIQTGIYILNISVDNTFAGKKIAITK